MGSSGVELELLKTVGKDGTRRAYGYDCLVRNTEDVKPASEIKIKASFEM